MKATYAQAGYKGPEEGPFQCGNCQHFDGQGQCELVAGVIDPKGECDLFVKGAAQGVGQQNSAFGAPQNNVLQTLMNIRGQRGGSQPAY